MDRIGKYEIHGQIGSGGFATVFKGYDPFIKRDVAIKICYANDAESRQRFFREAEIAGRLKHENITTVYDFGLHAEDPYLVEEYLDGEDLTQSLRRREPAELATKIDVLMQIARGLDYAHRRKDYNFNRLNIIHHAISPYNIMLSTEGEVKLMDFGIARAEFGNREAKTKSVLYGSVGYMAPERLDFEELPEGDVYALGTVLYEILVGSPFGKASIRTERHAEKDKNCAPCVHKLTVLLL